MSKLLDSILNKNLVEANENFLERINHIADEFSSAYLIPLAVA